MNARSFKVIFSKRLGALVAVGENATAQGKSASGEATHSASGLAGAASSAAQHVGVLKHICLAALLSSSTQAFALDANALPTGAELRHGAATVGTEGATMTINQTSSRATINWQSFNVGTDARVNVVQNNNQSVLLNRVVGNEMSQIRGQISANGQVVLVNPNGIVMGPTGRITASAFTASTFGISDTNFQDGHMKYERNGSNGKVVHQGHIQATEAGGYVALIGADVSNEGTIQTRQGAVVLAAAERVSLPSASDMNSVSVPLSRSVRLEIDPAAFGSASVANSGVIQTEGGQVLLRAAAVVDAVSKIADARVTHTGTIDTTGTQGGRVDVLADHGTVRVSGNVKANSTSGSAGGDVYIGRDEHTNVLAAIGDASGATLVSKGGFVETSGQFLATYGTRVKAKDWLLDPFNITIASSASGTPYNDPNLTGGSYDYTPSADSIIFASDIAASLNDGTNVTIATGLAGSPGTSDGNIIVDAAIVKSGNQTATLTLIANNGITVNQRIGRAAGDTSSTGQLNVNMTAHGGVVANGAQALAVPANSQGIVLNNVIDANGGTATLTGTTSNGSANGVQFNNNSGITAGSFTVTGNNTSTTGGSWPPSANGVRIGGNVNLTSTTANGTSLIRGSTLNSNGHGTFVSNGTVLNVNAQNDGSIAIDTAANSVVGMRVGFSGGATVNTDGNVTLGSMNSNTSQLNFQATANANSGNLTLLGRSGTGTGIALTEGGGVGARVVANNAATITIDGESGLGIGVMLGAGIAGTSVHSATGAISITGRSSATTGIYSQNTSTVSSTAGANITLTGSGDLGINLTNGSINTTGQVALNGTSVNNVAILNAASITGGSVVVDGQANGNGIGVASSGNMTANTGNMRIIGRSAGSGAGVYSSGAIRADAGSVTIEGMSVTGGGVTVQGAVTAQTDVSITGTSSSTASTNQGVVIQRAVTANTGNVTVTGTTNSNVQRAVAITANGANNGSLQTLAAGKTININADTLLINTLSSVNAGATGTVNIATTSSGGVINLGGADTLNSTPANRVLGLDQGELNRITAGKLVVGSHTAGNITVNSVTTATTTGNLELRTGGNVAINAPLTVGDDLATTAVVESSRNLTINATGNVTNGANGKINATDLVVTTTGDVGASGAFLRTNVTRASLTTAGSQFLQEDNALTVSAQTTVGSAGNIHIKTDNGTLRVDSFNGVAGVTARTGNITLEGNTDTGNGFVIAQTIETTGDVTLRGTTRDAGTTQPPPAGVFSTTTGVVKGKNITMVATANSTNNNGATLGYYGAAGRFEASESLNLTGSSNNNGNGFYTFGGSLIAGTGMVINGTSTKGQGVGLDNAVVVKTTTGNINITGTAIDANQQAIGLRGAVISNDGGNIVLSGLSGDIVAGTGPLNATTGQSVWGGEPRTNTITSNGSGAIQIKTASSTPSSSDMGSIDGTTLSIVQNGNGGVEVSTSGQGNVITPKITNAGTGAVVIAAGSTLPAGTGTGGQIKTVAGNTITNNNGTTRLYSGAADSTGDLSRLDITLANLYLSDVGSNLKNTQFNSRAGETMTSTAPVQVFFREATNIGAGALKGADLVKEYGDVSTRNGQGAALLADMVTRLKEVNSGNKYQSTNAGRLIIAQSALVDDLAAANQNVALTNPLYSGSGFLRANAVGYNNTLNSGAGFGTSLEAGQTTKVIVNKRALNVSGLTAQDKAFDTNTAAQLTGNANLVEKVGIDDIILVGLSGNFNSPDVGTNKPVNLSGNLDGADKDNYDLVLPVLSANITGAVEPIDPPTPVVPVVPPTNNNVVVTVAAASNNFVLAGAEGQCSADTLEQCECETATTSAGAAIDGIQICYEPKGRAAGAPL